MPNQRTSKCPKIAALPGILPIVRRPCKDKLRKSDSVHYNLRLHRNLHDHKMIKECAAVTFSLFNKISTLRIRSVVIADRHSCHHKPLKLVVVCKDTSSDLKSSVRFAAGAARWAIYADEQVCDELT